LPPPARPERLGSYVIVAKIAGGGMSTIYLGRADDPACKERVAAVKVIRQELAQDARMIQMFLEEGKVLALLSHPNILRTFEYGATNEQQFIAMELLLGRTLADTWEACAANKLALRADMSAWVCARVADALHYAHDLCDEAGQPLGLVHRDVNPSNVFLTFDGRVVLFDFGLVNVRVKRAPSAAGIVKGKLPYLAPEQIMQFPIDRRADVFMLGTTLWELTTMRRLFKRDDDVETVKAVRSGPIPDPTTILPGFPERLARVVKKALERNRDRRHPTAKDLAEELDAFVGAAAGDMPDLVSGILDHLFPGERARQRGWLKRTSALAPDARRSTVAPPAPLPTSSVRVVPPQPPSRPRKA